MGNGLREVHPLHRNVMFSASMKIFRIVIMYSVISAITVKRAFLSFVPGASASGFIFFTDGFNLIY